MLKLSTKCSLSEIWMLIDSNWNICRKLCWIMKHMRKMTEVLPCKHWEIIRVPFFLTFPARSTPAWRSAPPACKCLEIWLWYQRDISSENLIESRYETAVNDWGPRALFPPSSKTSESLLFVYLLRRYDSTHYWCWQSRTTLILHAHVWIRRIHVWTDIYIYTLTNIYHYTSAVDHSTLRTVTLFSITSSLKCVNMKPGNF